MTNAYAIMTIAQRDLVKFLRDPWRMVTSFIFPVIFIAVLGGSLQANLGDSVGYDFLAFTFTGIFAQTLFQSSASGVISLIQDRTEDFSQELFVSPVSRYSIVLGKVVGETLVALPQGLAIIAFAFLLGVDLSPARLIGLLVIAVPICLVGAAFGFIILSNLSSPQAANQVFPFVLLPQFFLAGIFNPIQVLPPYLEFISKIAPLRYAVDLARNVYYLGSPEESRVVLEPAGFNLVVMAGMFGLFLVIGTWQFVRAERNR